MEHASFLVQAFVYLTAALVSVPIAKRLGLGSVLGYLIAGAIIGPFGLALLGQPENVMHFAEFGVVIMLFLIGLEMQPALLWRLRTAILGLGGAQVVVSTLIICAIGIAAGFAWNVALACGLILSLSSTAIVLTSLRERALSQTQVGQSSFSILLFQDLALIPMLALIPLLAIGHGVGHEVADAAHGHDGGVLAELPGWAQTVAVVSAVVLIITVGRLLTRPVFRFIAATNLQEVFTAAALLLVVGVSLLMQTVGLSPALGAFLAGVVLADSEFRHEVEADIEPFRGLLLGLFFISVGASINFALLASEPLLIFGMTVALIVVKAAIIFGLAQMFGHHRSDATLMALGLAQGGEFAFVLFAFSTGAGVIPDAVADPLIAVVALTMAMTPVLFILGEYLSTSADMGKEQRAPEIINDETPDVIVAGFGRFGQAVGRLLIANGYRTSVLEHSADQIELLRGFGQKVNYGDASRTDLLRAAGAEEAKALVVAVGTQEKSLEIVRAARQNFPHLKILCRAFDRRHAYELLNLGVEQFEREMFESGVALGVKTLQALGQRAHHATRAGRLFARHDRDLLLEMSKYWGDDLVYRQEVRARSGHVDQLLRRDLNVFAGGDPDKGAWDTKSLEEEIRRDTMPA